MKVCKPLATIRICNIGSSRWGVYNATSARGAGIICRTCADDVLDLGKCEAKTQNGNTVRAYDIERTLRDIVRGQKVIDLQVVVPAMRAYATSKNRNITKLMDYAHKLEVESKIRGYMEVLL